VTPRAIRSKVFAMARPSRPPSESRAVREAAGIVRAETGLTTADPVASIIAARVVEAMKAYQMEDLDPLLAAMGELQRRACPSPFNTLATDPGIDSIALFTEARVERVRNRCGRSLSVREDEAECSQLWATVHAHLWRRYIRTLRRAVDA
jgi:hypothetical protein